VLNSKENSFSDRSIRDQVCGLTLTSKRAPWRRPSTSRYCARRA